MNEDEIAMLKAELATAKENELKALREMGRLKAELAKRPEVVFCKDCRAMQKGDQIDPERLTCVHGAIVEPYDFCSMGQRRESEEGE